MQIDTRAALVTGANRGLGRLDVTDHDSISAAARTARDVSLIINNAGSFTGVSLVDGDRNDIDLEMRTHYFGPLDVVRAFNPQLAAQHTLVSALRVGFMDTDMAADVDAPKSDPAVVASLALDGLAADEVEILADDMSRAVRADLAGGAAGMYPGLLSPAA